MFRCTPRTCPYYNQNHPDSARDGKLRGINYAAIPRALAEQVAAVVDSKLILDQVRFTKEIELTQEEQEEFNEYMKLPLSKGDENEDDNQE